MKDKDSSDYDNFNSFTPSFFLPIIYNNTTGKKVKKNVNVKNTHKKIIEKIKNLLPSSSFFLFLLSFSLSQKNLLNIFTEKKEIEYFREVIMG